MALDGTTTLGDGDVNAAQDEEITGVWRFAQGLYAGGSVLRDVDRVDAVDNHAHLTTGGGGADHWDVHDKANNQSIAEFHEGGNVLVENGDVDLDTASDYTFRGSGTTLGIYDSVQATYAFYIDGSQNAPANALGGPDFNGAFVFDTCMIWENNNGELVARDSAGNDTVIS